jgi:DNA-nicking Smr family endonuclease
MNAQDDDEIELFRRAMKDVQPLKRVQRAPGKRRAPRAQARFARAERESVLSESLSAPGPFIDAQPGEELVFRREGVPESVLRDMRRGRYRVEAELDLHGLRAQDASLQLAQFLQRVRARGLQCVRVIHGKGLRSGQRGPVLKITVNTLLRRAEPVLAFTSAAPKSGGTGATLVLLRRAPPP